MEKASTGSHKLLVLLFAIWLIAVVVGSLGLLRYSFQAGGVSSAPPILPGWLKQMEAARPRIVLALHPRCPCSRATVRELAKILTRARNLGETVVLVYKPAGESNDWIKGFLVSECERLKCRILVDEGGRLAASLGCVTSGDLLLYDEMDRLRYRGGITSSRGHEGDNGGEQAVIDILLGQPTPMTTSPVFGCPIQQHSTEPTEL